MFKQLKVKMSQPRMSGPVEYMIVGLGNPGSKYDGTRHNVGFAAIDYLAKQYDCRVDQIKFKSLCGRCTIGGKQVLMLKPSTFMNLSGQAVVEAANFYKLPMNRVLVLFDDVSLDPGRMRIRLKGSDGGHNGIKNIVYLSGRDDFPRIKIGVGGKPHPDYDLADWVLGHFTKDQAAQVAQVFEKLPKAVELMVQEQADQAMNLFNR